MSTKCAQLSVLTIIQVLIGHPEGELGKIADLSSGEYKTEVDRVFQVPPRGVVGWIPLESAKLSSFIMSHAIPFVRQENDWTEVGNMGQRACGPKSNKGEIIARKVGLIGHCTGVENLSSYCRTRTMVLLRYVVFGPVSHHCTVITQTVQSIGNQCSVFVCAGPVGKTRLL